jgi:hypothetical protein
VTRSGLDPLLEGLWKASREAMAEDLDVVEEAEPWRP